MKEKNSFNFRAWLNIEEKYAGQEMYEVKGWDEEGLVMLYDAGDFSWDEVIIMQSTGLKDINGVEIYEGDIVIIDDYFEGKIKAEVVFEQGSFGLVAIHETIAEFIEDNWNDHFLTFAYLKFLYEHPENELLNVLKIGNIYENPELLEAPNEII